MFAAASEMPSEWNQRAVVVLVKLRLESQRNRWHVAGGSSAPSTAWILLLSAECGELGSAGGARWWTVEVWKVKNGRRAKQTEMKHLCGYFLLMLKLVDLWMIGFTQRTGQKTSHKLIN